MAARPNPTDCFNSSDTVLGVQVDSQLVQRVHTSGFTFSPGWVHALSVTPELIVCCMEANGREPVAVMTVQVADDLSWMLTTSGREVEMSEVFHIQKDASSAAVLTIILNIFQVCEGNLESAHADPCISPQHGKFNDCTGT